MLCFCSIVFLCKTFYFLFLWFRNSVQSVFCSHMWHYYVYVTPCVLQENRISSFIHIFYNKPWHILFQRVLFYISVQLERTTVDKILETAFKMTIKLNSLNKYSTLNLSYGCYAGLYCIVQERCVFLCTFQAAQCKKHLFKMRMGK